MKLTEILDSKVAFKVKNPNVIVFSASKDLKEKNNRAALYERLMKRFKPTGYFVHVNDHNPDSVVFRLVKDGFDWEAE